MIPGRDRVDQKDGTTYIDGYEVRKHGEYLGWEIYRTAEDGPMAVQFIAVRVMEKSGLVSVQAKNLEGIKRIIRREEGFA